MKRTMVFLPESLHKDIKRLAVEQETSVAALIREALESLYQEDLEDIKEARARLADYLKNPAKSSDYSAYRNKRTA